MFQMLTREAERVSVEGLVPLYLRPQGLWSLV